jgi:hypothetical protein
MTDISARGRRLAAVRRALERQRYPRVQMFVIVLLTGLAGFAASFIMLHMGVGAMALRYLLALCVAYLMFLFIVWVWLRFGADSLDAIDPGVTGGADGPAPVPRGLDGAGGTFDGGGASGNYEVDGAAGQLAMPDAASGLDVGDLDAGEAVIPLFVAALIAGVVCCALFIVYAAPMLFAELLVDGILSASLYRRLRGIDRHHWLETALRRTFWPFVFAAVSVTALGWGLANYAPGAQSIGEALGGHARAAP